MSDIINADKNFILSIDEPAQHENISRLGRALSSADRLKVLALLQYQPMNLLEISKALDMPISSVSKHIDALAEAQLIFVNYQPGPKGHVKICSKMVMSATVKFDDPPYPENVNKELSVEMPLGQFTGCDITAPCGMAGKKAAIETFDNPNVFFSPERIGAELLWFDHGFITYMFPNHFMKKRNFSAISFSLEACSEAVYYRNNWPSDITVLINDVEIATYTSPGDYGGRRGKFTPDYWPVTSTQFGQLKRFNVTAEGVFDNNVLVNKAVTFNDLALINQPYIKFSIGVKPDAVHRGGINLFGKNFGDFPQSIIMTLT